MIYLMNSNKAAKRVALYGMLIALSMVFSYVEAMIPIPIPIPGVKLGLANLVTIVGLYTVGVRPTIIITLIRIVLVGFTFGNGFSMIYSLAGGALSLFLMVFARRTGFFSQTGVSIIGGIGHNIGQLIVAAIITKTAWVFSYFPFLLIAGTIAGALIGLLGGLITERIKDKF